MEAASRLRHERCVRAYDFGGDAGHVYIAYEYVRGRTLRETLRTDPHRLSPNAAPPPFDRAAYAADPAAYLSRVEPGRAFQTAPVAAARRLFCLAARVGTSRTRGAADRATCCTYVRHHGLAGAPVRQSPSIPP